MPIFLFTLSARQQCFTPRTSLQSPTPLSFQAAEQERGCQEAEKVWTEEVYSSGQCRGVVIMSLVARALVILSIKETWWGWNCRTVGHTDGHIWLAVNMLVSLLQFNDQSINIQPGLPFPRYDLSVGQVWLALCSFKIPNLKKISEWG